MIKKIEIINENVLDTCEEYETEINGRKVTNIDISSFTRERKIVFNDENRRIICEVFVPQTMLVKVSYM